MERLYIAPKTVKLPEVSICFGFGVDVLNKHSSTDMSSVCTSDNDSIQ